ncbi:MAG TPA: FtsX-like permease family protein [Blastocatellia bacterium]|nr:FtsX-like permease family protein [Blastocatellia bacterium]
MDNLVLSNILYRKTRTVTTMAGVALGVVLVVLTVGIAHGFLRDQGRRNAAVTAEIIVGGPGTTFGLSLNPTLSLSLDLADKLRAIEGVIDVVPVGQYLHGRVIDGIDYASFTRVSDVRVVEGKPAVSGDEAMIDRVQQKQRKLNVGDPIEVFDRQFRIVGIYEPESLGRIKVPLATMQQYLNRPLCSMLLVKLSNPAKQEDVAKQIKEQYPDDSVVLTRDLPILIARGTPALQTFLSVVIALSIIVSSLVILLTMYTTVTERTRQIGVLKSLGASKGWIAGEIEKEAVLISALGVLVGSILAVAGKYLITRLTPISVELEPAWLFYALVLGLLAGALGALYPALRAANQDPVTALAYE